MVEAIVLPRSQKRKRLSVPSDCCVKRRSGRPEKTVRFNPDITKWNVGSLFDGMDPAEERELRSDLWYTVSHFMMMCFYDVESVERSHIRHPLDLQLYDFDRFTEDRVRTMRVWHAVGGDIHYMEPTYCLRGLENLQPSSITGDIQVLRSQHQRAVLSEQERQRASSSSTMQPVDSDYLAQVSLHHSSWSADRAVRFAVKDSVDVAAFAMDPTSEFADVRNHLSMTRPGIKMRCYPSLYSKFSPPMNPCHPSLSLKQLMPKLSSSHASSAASRESLAKFQTGLAHPMRNSCERNSVDVPMLKQLNKQFLRGFVHTGGPSFTGGSQSFGSYPSSSLGTLDLLNEALNATADDVPA